MSAEVVIICRGLASGEPVPDITGLMLASFDPEGNDGYGKGEWTDDPGRAMRFPSIEAAHACWTAVPRSRPVRMDGQPNRPLTAVTIEIATAPEL